MADRKQIVTRNYILRMFPNATESFIKANLGREDIAPIPEDALTIESPVKIQESTDVLRLNKTESKYYQLLQTMDFKWIGVQAITLKLGDDCRYTCDFMCLDDDGNMSGREVKGFFRDDAKVKIKVAARNFPWIKFFVVTLDKSGWTHTEINS